MKFSLILLILMYFSIMSACNNPSNQLIEEYLKKMEIDISYGNKYIIIQTQYCKPCQNELLTNMLANRICLDEYQIIIVKSTKILDADFKNFINTINVIVDEKSEFNKLNIYPFENILIIRENEDFIIQPFDENCLSKLCN
ncbi:MAG: hypothetical protein KIT33_09160 [Candidatus Kapabacteria bacterium]|nr:hypothetical protein [Ignavibacteriota bacterium]MCW5885124.1 hypothetical protein [Candidatus Kapabacteria bacterium]